MSINESIEKHQFKIQVSVAVLVILFVMATTTQFARWQAQMEATHQEFDDRIIHVGEKIIDMRADINDLNDKAAARDVELAKISTKLANIETLLIEIKTDLKEHSS